MYEFWLSWGNGKEKMRLPVNPASIKIDTAFSHNDVEVLRLGEFTVIGERGLAEFSFSSFFPAEYNPSYCEYRNVKPPWDHVKVLERWRDSRKPMRLIVTGTPINYPVTIRSFSYDPGPAGSPRDIYYEISFKEYRLMSAKEQKPGQPAKDKRPPAPKPAPPKSHTVKKGDSLWAIAQRVYGKGSDWRKIYDANRKAIGANPNAIKPGQKLVIP